MKLSELEKQLNFTFPKKWHEIYNTGAMEWLELDSKSLSREERYNKIKAYYNDPTQFLLLGGEIEPIFFEDYAVLLEDLKDWISWKCEDDHAKLKDGVKLLPFAQTGGGDMFCFIYEDDIEQARIGWYYHDDYDTPKICAGSLDEFLYFSLLNAAVYALDNNENFTDSEAFHNHVKYLSDEYKTLVEGKNTEELSDEFESLVFEEADIWDWDKI